MKKDYILDYLSCIVFKGFGPIVRALPLNFSLFLGRSLGILLCNFDSRHRARVYANIKMALGDKLSHKEISAITKQYYRNFGQNLIELFLIPIVRKKYFNKYISVEGGDNPHEAFKQGRGVILVAMHAGNWELSNIVCANLGFPFSLFVRGQKFVRLNGLLNSLRQIQGYKIIERENQVRGILEALKRNEAIGMTVDQGGRTGELVKFFGKEASMSTGAIKIAMKNGAVILPSYYVRVNGPYQKVIFGEPFKIDNDASVNENLQRLVSIFEQIIVKHPQEYNWLYKIWKYGKEKNVLILSDGKAGHLRQAQAVAKIIQGVSIEKGIKINIDELGVEFKNKFSRRSLAVASLLSGKYNCQGCAWCLRKFLKAESYQALVHAKADIIISCGSATAAANFVLTRQNSAKSIVLMRPSILSARKFDLVIMPRHDRPPKRENVLATEGALNLIDEEYLKEQAEKLRQTTKLPSCPTNSLSIGLLLGGNAKDFHLEKETMVKVIEQIKLSAERNNADILVTTSRRTPQEIEKLVKAEFQDYPRCKLFVIANERNIPETIGGILGLSEVVVISPESISMISEAVNSKKYVVVFKAPGLDRKHRDFLKHFSKNKYIYFIKISQLAETICELVINKPLFAFPKDNDLVAQAVKKIL